MATAKRDYYDILGVSRDADQKAIKAAFRELAMKYHPDRNKAADAEERFKEIAEAYAVLSDEKKRAEYDHGGFAGVEGYSPEDLFGGIDFGDIFGDLGFGFDFGGGLFDRLFRHGGRRGPAKGADLEIDLDVSLARIVQGGEETVRYARLVTCPACQGSGAAAGTQPHNCAACDGSGRKVVSRQEKGGVHFQQITTCPVCNGKGTVIDKPCEECGGNGRVERQESLKINIPIGVEDGTALRVTGHGLPSPQAGGPPGDLYVVVRASPDPRFERAGADLWRVETIDVADAVLGTHLEVPTLDGNVDVTIPPGTQPDEVLRLRGKGLPVFGAKQRGDINLRMRIHIPEKPSKEERELYRRLRSVRRK